jgi:hypothetical protein
LRARQMHATSYNYLRTIFRPGQMLRLALITLAQAQGPAHSSCVSCGDPAVRMQVAGMPSPRVVRSSPTQQLSLTRIDQLNRRSSVGHGAKLMDTNWECTSAILAPRRYAADRSAPNCSRKYLATPCSSHHAWRAAQCRSHSRPELHTRLSCGS